MSEKETAIFLFLVAFGAFFMPFLSKRLLLPAAVGEMIYGIVLASIIPYGQDEVNMVTYFSSLGFLILMYLAGLELDFDKFKALPSKELWVYLLTFIPIAVSSVYIADYFSLHWSFGLIFFATGIGLVFPVLKETNLIQTDFGQKLLIIITLGEILTLIGVTIVTIVSKSGFTIESAVNFASIAVFFIVIYISMRMLKLLLWWKPHLQSIFLEVGNPTETGMRANFVILFAFVAFAAIFHVEFVVGAFIGGMMFALVFAGREEVIDKLGGVGYGFFIPIFFINVGMQVTFSDFFDKQVIILAFKIILAMVITRLIGSIVLFFSDIPKSRIILVTTGMSFPLTMLVAVSTICYEANMINKLETSAVLLAAMISAIIFPWVFKAISAILIPGDE